MRAVVTFQSIIGLNVDYLGTNIERLIPDLQGDAEHLSQDDAYLEFTARDAELLKHFRECMNVNDPGFLDAFYRQLLSFSEVKACLSEQGLIDQLRKSQQHFIDCLTKGDKHDKCIADRKRIGVIQQGLGIKSKWVLSAYNSFMGDILTRIIAQYQDDYKSAIETISALMKIVFFDIAICFDINIFADRNDSSNFLRAIVQNTADGLIAINERGQMLFCNSTIEDMFGYTAQEIHGENITRFMLSNDAGKHDRHIQNYIESGRSNVLGSGMREVQGMRKDGTVIFLDISISEVFIGNERAFIGVLRDCTDRKEEQTQMRKLSGALEQSADTVLITNPVGVIEYVNPSFERITGFSKRESVGNKPNILKSGLQDEEFYDRLWKTILEGDIFRDVVVNRKKDGTIYYEEKTITPLFDAQTGQISHFISTGKDITDRMQAQQRLHHLAYYDLLTELPNRTLFLERLNTAITRARRHERLVAVLLINLDRFKVINDTLGHEVGDALLVELAKRLEKLLRQEDTVAHLGGDTFAILLEEFANVEDIPDLVQKALQLIDKPFQSHGRELYTTASIGVSLYPQDGRNSSSLMRHAEVAMYRVKSAGRNNYQFYTADMNAKALKRLEMETNLRKALEREEFILYYQPLVDLTTRHIVGLEALVRWQHPELGLVAPNEFIPLLEETGLIIPAGQWILEQACLQNREWRKAGLAELRTSVNLSALQFRQRNLANDIAYVLSKTDLPPSALQLELTESSIMDREENVLRTLGIFQQMGVQLAIDDFGTGYSSLSYLKNIPVNVLKLDKSFVDGLPMDNRDIGIARAVIAMAHSLGMKVVAEGVETEAQLNFLQEEGCDIIQGYLFSRPVPATAVPDLIASGKML